MFLKIGLFMVRFKGERVEVGSSDKSLFRVVGRRGFDFRSFVMRVRFG